MKTCFNTYKKIPRLSDIVNVSLVLFPLSRVCSSLNELATLLGNPVTSTAIPDAHCDCGTPDKFLAVLTVATFNCSGCSLMIPKYNVIEWSN